MVRQDFTGSLGVMLRGYADLGDRLFRSGHRVADGAEYCTWLGERLAWHATATESLSKEFDAEVVEEFTQTASARATGEWRNNLSDQLRALRDEVEFLDSLWGGLVWQTLERKARAQRSRGDTRLPPLEAE